MSNRQDIDRVREAVDLVELIAEYIPLQPKGQEWVCVCPFHDDHKPSMCVVTHRDHAFYKCFSCDAYGDCFGFLQEYLKISFVESLQMLAERTGIELANQTPKDEEANSKRKKLQSATAWALELYVQTLASDSAIATRTYLENRGINTDSIQTFSIGLAPDSWTFLTDKIGTSKERSKTGIEAGLLKSKESSSRVYDAFRNRIMFPIFSEAGKPIAFGGRRINEEDEPKYINSPETELFHKSKTLYGYHLARSAMQAENKAIVVEGYTDVIACHQVGVTNVVATLGTSLTPQHAQKLSRICDEVTLVFDGDEAGQRAADRAVEIFFSKDIDVNICVLPEGKDPADMATDKDALLASFEKAVDAITYKFDRIDATLKTTNTISGRAKNIGLFLDELIRLGIGQLPGIKKPLVHERIATLLKVPMEEVQAHLDSRIQKRIAPKQQGQSPIVHATEVQEYPAVVVARARLLAEHELLSVILFDSIQSSAALRESGEPIQPENFLDRNAAQIANCIIPKLLAGTSFTIQETLSELSPEASNLASTLYFEGERICNEAGSVSIAIQRTIQSFQAEIKKKAITDNVRELKNYEDPEQRAMEAQKTLEAIRKNQKRVI
jgi:DNA primase